MRTISDEYELPGDDDGDGSLGSLLRRPRRPWAPIFIVAAVVLLTAAALVSFATISREEQKDTFCTDCHTQPETVYHDRATSAVAGALAVDLASFHYQQIQGQGGTIHCIDCHKGNGSLSHAIDRLALSARNTLSWLTGDNDPAVEKLRLQSPALANDTCTGCHSSALLLAGLANHYHNMLPAAYAVWRNGGNLIAPDDATDKQAVIAGGLVQYETSVQCSDCHPSHRTLETDIYLDKQTAVPKACVQCHRDVQKGPLTVTVP